MRLLIHNAKQVVQVSNTREKCKIQAQMNNVVILQQNVSETSSDEKEEGISIAIDKSGRIAAIDKNSAVKKLFADVEWDEIIDASDKCIIPGLVDAHTHPVWAGDRVHEFVMKLSGASYIEVHKAGGGIHFTVDKTKQATHEHLVQSFKDRLKRMSKSGTTTVECKSGYGLNIESEIKMLKVIEEMVEIGDAQIIDVISTYCGAHAVPKGKSVEEATKDVLDVQLPAIKALVDSNKLSVRNVDVFCETGVFGVEETRKILEKAKAMGFRLNYHAEELTYIGGAEMGASLQAEAISHLEQISDNAIEDMAKSGSAAVILPTTAFLLRLPHPPVRKMIEKGVPVALGTDFNPNAHCTSMPLVMHMACVLFRMTPNEALVAATLNAARSLRLEQDLGSIEVGKFGNLVVLNAPRWEHLVYQLGGENNTIECVIYRGRIVN